MKTNSTYLRKWFNGRYPLTGLVIRHDKNVLGDPGVIVAVVGKSHQEFWLTSEVEPLILQDYMLDTVQQWIRLLTRDNQSPETLPLR